MLGLKQCQALPFIYALTGCDTVSSMLGIDKKTAWSAWQASPETTDTLVAICQNPTRFTLLSQYMQDIELFVVRMYSRNCNQKCINTAKKTPVHIWAEVP